MVGALRFATVTILLNDLVSKQHHIAGGACLLRYVKEASWREDNRRLSNGDQVGRVAALEMKRGKSVDFHGLLATTHVKGASRSY
jgi:hypothetical protein